MVKTLLMLIITNVVGLLELVGVVLLAVAVGLLWGASAVLAVVGVALLGKSMELDVRRERSRSGGG